MLLARRGLLRGLLAAPAIVAAGSLMPVRVPKLLLTLDEFDERYLLPAVDHLLTEQDITQEAIKLWKNSNSFLQPDMLRINLPTAFTVNVFHIKDRSNG